jgi:hypothetical protein
MPEYLFFILGLSCLLTHELDAVRCQEWRIFPATAFLKDATGYAVFTLAHVPLFAALLFALWEPASRSAIARGLDIFFIVHLALHLLYLKHPLNRFTTPLSWSLILLAAVLGALDIALG